MLASLNSQKGTALITVIMAMLVVMLLGGAALALITSQTKTVIGFEQDINALHVAEAGLHQYLWYMNKEGGTLNLGSEQNPVLYPDAAPRGAFYLEEVQKETGRVIVRSTGWMLADPASKRVIEAIIVRRTFTEYVYFSDDDPENIWWISGEKCYGPYHTNSTLRIAGSPIFYGRATYAEGIEYNWSYHNNPQFRQGYAKVPRIPFPSNNNQLKTIAQNDGYLYQGRTSIKLNANGTVTIRNKNGSPVTRPLPPEGVIYVNGTMSSNMFDINAGNAFVSGKLNGRLTIASSNDIYITGYDPTNYDFNQPEATDGISYQNTSFILNETTGVVTVTGSEQAMLGLVAQKDIGVLTRGWFNNPNIDSARRNITIHGAIMAITGSFKNTHHDRYPTSPAGNLTVRGSIIQKTRGPVGTFNQYGVTVTGYAKNYAYDPRMMYDNPPHFLKPENSGWEIRSWTEI